MKKLILLLVILFGLMAFVVHAEEKRFLFDCQNENVFTSVCIITDTLTGDKYLFVKRANSGGLTNMPNNPHLKGDK